MQRIVLFVFGVLCSVPVGAQSILPPPPVPAGNAITPDKVLLGKALFWDEQLSSSRTMACGTCHVFAAGGSDPRSLTALHPGADRTFDTADDVRGSPGVVRHARSGALVADPSFGMQPQVTDRKAPTVVNAAYSTTLFHDGRASDTFVDPVSGTVVLTSGGALESQAAAPPVSATEMSHMGRTWSEIAIDIQDRAPLALADRIPAPLAQFVAGQTYAALFAQVFGSPGVTPTRIVLAIATYERTLISDQSPFDRYLAGLQTLTPMQQAGLTTFQSLCAACHTDLDPQVLTRGPATDDFRNIGVRPNAEDSGRAAVTNDPNDVGRFRVPGLRNVALRAPYFHNGSVPTIGEVVDFYARGGDAHENQDPLVASIVGHVTIGDRLAIDALLQALTDPRVANELPPFDRPRLWSEGAHAPVRIGHGTAGTGALEPRASVAGAAYRGNGALGIGVDRCAPGLVALLALDPIGSVTPIDVLGHDVHLGLSADFGVVVAPALTAGTGPAGAATSVGLVVPDDPGLVGLAVYGQWVVLDPAGPAGFATSDAFSFELF